MPPPPFTPHWALFLDVDGTLLEHAPRPQDVLVGARLLDLLRDLARAPGGAIALISGRSIADLDQLFAPLRLPSAGQHGAERRGADGVLHGLAPALLESIATAKARIDALVATHPGLLAEHKGASIALHYRRAPDLYALVESEMQAIAAQLGDAFETQGGKFVKEIKPRGTDKGAAIAAFMAEKPYARRTPVFLGDDLTDEHGFALVNASGGHSVKVGAGPSCARWRLRDAAAVREWLDAGIRAIHRP